MPYYCLSTYKVPFYKLFCCCCFVSIFNNLPHISKPVPFAIPATLRNVECSLLTVLVHAPRSLQTLSTTPLPTILGRWIVTQSRSGAKARSTSYITGRPRSPATPVAMHWSWRNEEKNIIITLGIGAHVPLAKHLNENQLNQLTVKRCTKNPFTRPPFISPGLNWSS